jgi:hypothetical protein
VSVVHHHAVEVLRSSQEHWGRPVADDNNLGFRYWKLRGTSEFYTARERTHRSLDQMADEAKRLTSMVALLSSLKLVVTWLKPGRMGETKRGGNGLWSFEKYGAALSSYSLWGAHHWQALQGGHGLAHAHAGGLLLLLLLLLFLLLFLLLLLLLLAILLIIVVISLLIIIII